MQALQRELSGLDLGDFYDAASLDLILVSYDSFHAVSVPALVNPVTVREEFTHDHWLAASDAVKSSRAPLVEQKTKVNPPSISFLLQVLSIGEGERLPVSSVLGSRLVLEIATSYNRGTVAFRDINWILRVRHFDPWTTARRSRMASWNRLRNIMMNGRMMASGHS